MNINKIEKLFHRNSSKLFFNDLDYFKNIKICGANWIYGFDVETKRQSSFITIKVGKFSKTEKKQENYIKYESQLDHIF